MSKRLASGIEPTALSQSADGPARRIIAAARQHFFAHGVRGVTMDDLAAELGMSKKTLYACFPSKTDLLRAVLLDKFQRVDADLHRVMSESSGDVWAALQALLACLRAHTEEIQPPFVRDMRREDPELFALVESRRRYVIERYIGRIFEQGRRAGIIRSDIPAHLMIEILLAVTDALMNPAKISQLGISPKTGYVTIFTVLLEGLLTDKGRKK